MSNNRILYLCESPAFHVSNEIYTLQKNGFEVIVVNLFNSPKLSIEQGEELAHVSIYNMHENLPLYPKIKYSSILYRHLFFDMKLIESLIEKYKIEIYYTSWSSVTLVDGYFIKKKFPELKWIHRFLMYPASLNKAKIVFENFYTKKYVSYIDEVIVHTNNMKKYLIENVSKEFEKSSVLPEKFNETYFLKDTLYSDEINKNRYKLIFLGTIGVDNENDIFQMLKNLPKQIDIYIAENINMKSKYLKLPNVKLFSKKSLGKELSHFIQQFDGILSLYNSIYSNTPRINNVIPNRITIGLPSLKKVFIPEDQLDGCKPFLRNQGLLCEYKCNEDLLVQLSNLKPKSFDEIKHLKRKLVLNNEFVQKFKKDVS